MIPVKHIDPDDLALYAMNLLPPDETAEMASNLEHSSQARRLLAEIRGDLSLLALSAEPQAPAADARERLLSQAEKEKKALPIHAVAPVATGAASDRSTPTFAESEAAPRSATARVLPWLGWAIAAGLLLEAGNLYQQREHLQHTVAASRAQVISAETRTSQAVASAELANQALDTVQDPAAIKVALTASGLKPPPQARASYVPGRGALVFLASNLEPLRPGKTYELWLIPANGHSPIPAGTFAPDPQGYASVILPSLPRDVQAKAFGVTIENTGGADAPTAPILLHGAAS